MNGEGKCIIGPEEQDDAWLFFMKSSYIECDDAPVAVIDHHPRTHEAIQLCKTVLPKSAVLIALTSNRVAEWDSTVIVRIDNLTDATLFKLTWVG
jgi:hypothetical protein